ncbi:PQQ-binding-like beta-propeller repeat protein [Xinfangfangia sp. CPCC 101601]|uniref:PQQ-binding-like beta-propeller repeat protein n=1 Tax=Pseudogemmobacter lacusdianii TaxID=3069608 RepID=A0ABU0VXY4_9RHOB|nr:PQQ-binding-like beta-propeller repeat protein [Xinfangfangia sp. CPCC 101601]MDQ2066619.1 PQQ-binding-like beta-propeller repeat protein [Xinfangfangia sp. CPCC 101601]
MAVSHKLVSGRNGGKRLGLLAGVAALTLLAACGEREVILPGERLSIRAASEGQESAAATSRAISLPAAQMNAEWAQRNGNARHVAPHAALSKAPNAVWAANIGASNSRKNRISAAPVVAGGRVFAMDSSAVVSALSTGGGLLWQADLTAAFDTGGGVSGGGLASNGAQVFATTAYGEVVALDAKSGGVIWRQRIDAPAIGAPAVDGGRVYVSGRDGSAWALDSGTGKVVWQVFGAPGKSGWLGAAAPTVGDGLVYFPSNAGDLMAVLKPGGGTPIWHSSAAGKRLGRAYAGSFDITGDAALVGQTLYAGTGAGRTIAVDAASGQQLWGAMQGAMGPLAIAGGSIFMVNDEARLVRLDAADGSLIWAVDMPYFENAKPKKRQAITAHYGPVLAGERIWVASSDGKLSAFSPTDGSMVYQTEIPGGAAAQPAVAGGVLYVVTTKGQVVAFR